jgi:hypothetical protein
VAARKLPQGLRRTSLLREHALKVHQS